LTTVALRLASPTNFMSVQSDSENPIPPVIRNPSRTFGRLLLGMIIGNTAGAILCAISYLLVQAAPQTGIAVTVPSLLLVPLIIGLVASRVWSPLNLGIVSILVHSLTCTLLAMGSRPLFFEKVWFA
jgi:hypothetical protein